MPVRTGRRATDPTSNKGTVNVVVIAIAILAVVAVMAIVIITALRPEVDNTPVIMLVIGVVTPIVLFLQSLLQRENHMSMNSRLDQLVRETQKLAQVEGIAKGASLGVDPKEAGKIAEAIADPPEMTKTDEPNRPARPQK